MPPTRSEIRNAVRQARNAIPTETSAELSRQICVSVMELESYQQSQNVAAFLAFDGEADPMHLMQQAVIDGKDVFVPMVIDKSAPLRFAPWRPDGLKKPNRYGIMEPQVDESEMLDANQLDFVVTPLVAFDGSCNRIGVGGGYYDRSFAFLNDASEKGVTVERPLLCGFAFAVQRVAAIPAEPWDVRLNFVATESELVSRT